jgi:hypothetical protein
LAKVTHFDNGRTALETERYGSDFWRPLSVRLAPIPGIVNVGIDLAGAIKRLADPSCWRSRSPPVTGHHRTR